MDPVVELSKVGRTYAGAVPVRALSDVDLTVTQGEYVAIVGPSGSGKTTLLNVLGLLDRPTAGTYRFRGRDTATLTDKQLSQARATDIGFVFQSFHLLSHRTIEDNVAMAGLYGPSARRDRFRSAVRALSQVGMGHRIGFPARLLSGGEKQRVAIARAIAHQPALLLCDEPTGNLDSHTTANILDELDRLVTTGLTVVVITHDPVVAQRSNRTVEITDGTLIEMPQVHV